MGNSEVGHLNLGARPHRLPGIATHQRSHPQWRICGEQKPCWIRSVMPKKEQMTLHLIGLVSDGGVHAHIEHLKALTSLCKREMLDKY